MTDPVTAVLVPGFLGGLVVAAMILPLQHRRREAPTVVMPYRPLPISTDVINMASIKVADGRLGPARRPQAAHVGRHASNRQDLQTNNP